MAFLLIHLYVVSVILSGIKWLHGRLDFYVSAIISSLVSVAALSPHYTRFVDAVYGLSLPIAAARSLHLN